MATKKSDLIPVSEQETARLIEASDGRPVNFAFGTGGAALISTGALWALQLLAEWRGLIPKQETAPAP